MSFKTKIFSLLLVFLLLLPAIVGPKPSGNVLGTVERKDNPTTSTDSEVVDIGEIGSGAFETRSVDAESNISKILYGKAIWDSNAKSQVITDKFKLGKSIVVGYESKKLNLVVGDVRILSDDTVLVLDKETFQKIGGNPEIQDSIDVSVIAD